MSRREYSADVVGFPVFDIINSDYPDKYKFISWKYDDSDTFCVWLWAGSGWEGYNDAPIILLCSREKILATKTLSRHDYYMKMYTMTIGDYLFFVHNNSISQYNYVCDIYRKSTLEFIRTVSNLRNYISMDIFGYERNGKHYCVVNTQSTVMAYTIICAEDGSVSHTESSSRVRGWLYQYDAVNGYYYDFRLATSGEGNIPLRLYRTSNIAAARDFINPLSNSIQYMVANNKCVPLWYYNAGDRMPFIYKTVEGSNTYFNIVTASDDYGTLSLSKTLVPSQYAGSAIYYYGAVTLDYKTFYTPVANSTANEILAVKFIE